MVVIRCIDLQEGFTDDRVILRLDGEEIAVESEVTTNERIGVARALALRPNRLADSLEVELPQRGIRGAFREPADRPVYVAVSVREGELEFESSHHPYGYL